MTTDFEEESYLIRQVLRRADQVIVLADHSKFDKQMFHRVAGLEDIDIIITDRELGKRGHANCARQAWN